MKSNFQRFFRFSGILCLIILFSLSGCTNPDKAEIGLEINRIYSNDAELQLISYVETFDFVSFTGLEDNSTKIFSPSSFNRDIHTVFLGNISFFIQEVKIHYNNSGYMTGVLKYRIVCYNFSSSNLTNLSNLTGNMENGIAAYVSNQNLSDIVINYDFEMNSLLSEIALSEPFWLVLIDLNYYLVDKYSYGYTFWIAVFLTPQLQVKGFISVSSYEKLNP